jgi:plastocyanin
MNAAIVKRPAGGKWLIAGIVILAVAALTLIQLGQASASGATATASGRKTVTINHFKFSPTPLHVSKGTTVVFANTSKVKHTATRRGSFDTGKIKPGHSVSVRFGAAGTYSYTCTLHPQMHGKIIVG